FPLGFVFVFIDSVIVLRVEVIRFLYLMKRGQAKQVDTIGGWRTCIQLMIIAAAITNVLLVAFTTDAMKWFGLEDTEVARLTFFIVAEHIVLFLVFGLERIVPDVPADIQRVQALEQYQSMRER